MSYKEKLSDLAVLGGEKAFASPLHVGRPNLGDTNAFLERTKAILDSRWLSNDGPMVKEFEQRISEYTGVKHCVAMCNATVALEIAIRALELKGEVIVPSYTFIATAHALQWQEITPVFADMDPATHNVDPCQIERLITPRTTGIIGVHVWGRACETAAIEEIANRKGLKVMFDAAHAFGCTNKGRMTGAAGACEVFSFHATKFLNSFEGGAVVTNDDQLAAKMRLMRNFGFVDYDRVIYPGTNGKMTEICAAMGLTSLDAINELIATNRRNYEAYQGNLKALPGISFIQYALEERNNYHYLVVEVDPDVATLNRDELVAVLHAENVLARKYFWPGCHRMEPYRSLHPEAALGLEVTERIASQIMVLPGGQAVGLEDIADITAIIRNALERAEEVRHALRSKSNLSS